MRISVQILPLNSSGPVNSLFPVSRPPLEPVHKYLEIVPLERTVGELFHQINEKYKALYLKQSDYNKFHIKKLQDEDGNDLSADLVLRDIATSDVKPTIIRVVQSRLDRESSVPHTSSLRPPDYKIPDLTKIGASHIEHEVSTDYLDVHPDQPVQSREIEVEADGRLDEIQSPRSDTSLRNGQLHNHSKELIDDDLSTENDPLDIGQSKTRLGSSHLNSALATADSSSWKTDGHGVDFEHQDRDDTNLIAVPEVPFAKPALPHTRLESSRVHIKELQLSTDKQVPPLPVPSDPHSNKLGEPASITSKTKHVAPHTHRLDIYDVPRSDNELETPLQKRRKVVEKQDRRRSQPREQLPHIKLPSKTISRVLVPQSSQSSAPSGTETRRVATLSEDQVRFSSEKDKALIQPQPQPITAKMALENLRRRRRSRGEISDLEQSPSPKGKAVHNSTAATSCSPLFTQITGPRDTISDTDYPQIQKACEENAQQTAIDSRLTSPAKKTSKRTIVAGHIAQDAIEDPSVKSSCLLNTPHVQKQATQHQRALVKTGLNMDHVKDLGYANKSDGKASRNPVLFSGATQSTPSSDVVDIASLDAAKTPLSEVAAKRNSASRPGSVKATSATLKAEQKEAYKQHFHRQVHAKQAIDKKAETVRYLESLEADENVSTQFLAKAHKEKAKTDRSDSKVDILSQLNAFRKSPEMRSIAKLVTPPDTVDGGKQPTLQLNRKSLSSSLRRSSSGEASVEIMKPTQRHRSLSRSRQGSTMKPGHQSSTIPLVEEGLPFKDNERKPQIPSTPQKAIKGSVPPSGSECMVIIDSPDIEAKQTGERNVLEGMPPPEFSPKKNTNNERSPQSQVLHADEELEHALQQDARLSQEPAKALATSSIRSKTKSSSTRHTPQQKDNISVARRTSARLGEENADRNASGQIRVTSTPPARMSREPTAPSSLATESRSLHNYRMNYWSNSTSAHPKSTQSLQISQTPPTSAQRPQPPSTVDESSQALPYPGYQPAGPEKSKRQQASPSLSDKSSDDSLSSNSSSSSHHSSDDGYAEIGTQRTGDKRIRKFIKHSRRFERHQQKKQQTAQGARDPYG